MRIGLFIHSRTGNTGLVAERLRESLEASGHRAVIYDVKPSEGTEDRPDTMRFTGVPDLTEFNGVIFGAPVHAFSLSPVMTAFIRVLPSLHGVIAGGFVTQAFPFPWMGGRRALGQMRNLVESRGGALLGAGVVNWVESRRERLTVETVRELGGLFSGF